MIQLAQSEDGPELLRRTAPPVTGVLCAMHWAMKQENPRLPHRFYLAGRQGVLKLSGGRATLCGPAEDAEELGAFLRFADVSQLTALDFVPPGWRVVEENRVLLRPPGPLLAPPRPLPGFEACPGAGEVIGVLESADGPIPPAARDFLYADLCARRNHGRATVYGVREGGELASTAGLWALAEGDAYLACVETRPQSQRRGYAGGLVARLCEQFGANRRLSLLCLPKLLPFYARFGFEETEGRGLISVID